MSSQRKGGDGHPTRRQFLALSAASTIGASCRTVPPRGAEEEVGQRPNVVVFVSDTLRADHLSCYGYGRPTTPEIDRFSAGSYLFEQCHSESTWTTPSTATILTGTSPLVHGTIVVEWTKEGQSRGGEYHVLSENIPTTAECLAEKQYSTGYFQANPNADRLRGHARGCEDYYYKINVSSTEHMDAVVAWLKARAKEPFYLFVHMIDPHKPHSVSPEMFAEVHGEELERSLDGISGFGKDLLNTHHVLEGASAFQKVHNLRADDQRKFSNSALEHLVKLYDSEIWGVDREFGRLLQTLEDMGVSDRTVVAFTSDHGEAFGEEDQYNHGNFLDDAQTHVPLLIRVPGQRKGERVPWTVRLSDLHPTLLTLADCDVSAPCTGSSLLSRDGRLLVSGDRGVLTTLDRNRSSRDLWDIGFTQGTLRVRLMKAEDRIEAYDLVSRRGGIVRYDQDPTSRDPRLRSGIQQLFGTVEDYTTRFAASEVGPTWGSEWRGKVSEDALKAVGYL